MPDIGHLTRPKRVEVTIDLGDDDSVTIGFDRNKVTPAWVSEAEKRDEQQDTRALPKALASVILDWDVTNDGQPYAATADNLAILSYPVQAILLEKILLAAVPSRAEGNDSSEPASTPSTDSSGLAETSPNGQETLPSPAPSASPSPT